MCQCNLYDSITDLRTRQGIDHALAIARRDFDKRGPIEDLDDADLPSRETRFVSDGADQIAQTQPIESPHPNEDAHHAHFRLLKVGECFLLLICMLLLMAFLPKQLHRR